MGKAKKSKSSGSKKAAAAVVRAVAPAPVRAAMAGASFVKGKIDARKGKKTPSGFKKKKSAKQLLKMHYERRAKRQIRMGQLGAARKTLHKKATVI